MSNFLIVLDSQKRKQLISHLGVSPQFLSKSFRFERNSTAARYARSIALNQLNALFFQKL